MRIVNLIENTEGQPGCRCEHGLSFYIETERHKVLMDTGASDGFLANADLLGIDLGGVDAVILSHGHYDHGGGIPAFAKKYPGTRIYMQQSAGGSFYHLKPEGEKYIGLEPCILGLPQCVLLQGDHRIDRELFLFSGIEGHRMWPEGNRALKRKAGAEYVQDDFCHEQCLVVSEGDFHVLLSGCAHNGVLNILDRYREIFGDWPDVLVSGFHMKKDRYEEADLEHIRETARLLKKTGILCFTGHCTGQRAFDVMKDIMGDQLRAIHSGEVVLDTGKALPDTGELLQDMREEKDADSSM